jgi:hypothetical protein
MPVAAPPPTPTFADAVRAGRWAEVRATANEMPAPLAPELALALARATRNLGDAGRALAIVRAALSNAGDLAAALRIEGAADAAALGQDPWPLVAPLLPRSSPPAQRRAAAACLRRAWVRLPLRTLRRVPQIGRAHV